MGKNFRVVQTVAFAFALHACSTTHQLSTPDFRPPEGAYKVIVMTPDVQVGVLTAGGRLEPREEWTKQARDNLLTSLRAQQQRRGGRATIAMSAEEAGADPQMVVSLDRLHEAVGQSIRLHKYTDSLASLPTKATSFDWTLGQLAVDYGGQSGYDYALFVHAEDSFASGGRMALQAMTMLGCVMGVCVLPTGGRQVAFASLVDLKDGRVVWYHVLSNGTGDIRTPEGAEKMIERLLDRMETSQQSWLPD